MYGSVNDHSESSADDKTEKNSLDMLDQVSEMDPPTASGGDNVQKRPLTIPLIFATCSVVIGSSLQFGYNTGVINNPKPVIQDFFNESAMERTGRFMSSSKDDFLFATTVAVFAAGGMIGSLIAGSLGDRFGRKGTLLMNNFIALLAGALMGFSKLTWSYEMLIIGRIIVGINCGINTGIVPMYLSEVSPFNLRGAISVTNQLGVTIGILLSQILGLPVLLGTEDLWSVCLGFVAVPAIIQLVTLPFCPESPRYLLIIKDNRDGAERALTWLRGDSNIQDEVAEMKREHVEEQKEERISGLQLLMQSSLRQPLIISIVMQLSQQLSGITAVLYYSTFIFEAAGLDEDKAQYATLSTGAVMVIMTIVSVPLMDRSGRRLLHLIGLGTMAIAATLLTIFLFVKESWSPASYICIGWVIVFTLGFAIGPGSIPWLIVAELFSQGPRPAAISIAFCVNWTANFTVGLLFIKLQEWLENYVFIIFIVLLIFFFIFTFVFVPETKNRSFEEISALFKPKGENLQDTGRPQDVTLGDVKYSALSSGES